MREHQIQRLVEAQKRLNEATTPKEKDRARKAFALLRSQSSYPECKEARGRS